MTVSRWGISDSIRIVQQKTGARLVIPVHAKLCDAMDATPKANLTVLIAEFCKPFSAAGFGNAFREWRDSAGLKGLSAQGLRKAAARRLAEADCTTSQLAAITGHTLGERTR